MKNFKFTYEEDPDKNDEWGNQKPCEFNYTEIPHGNKSE